MATRNEAMYYFMLAPDKYRKILFVKRDFCEKYQKALAEYYVGRFAHMIPPGVEIMEYDLETNTDCQIVPR